MADHPSYPDASDETGAGGGAAVAGTASPRWKVALLLMIVLHLIGVVGANTGG